MFHNQEHADYMWFVW